MTSRQLARRVGRLEAARAKVTVSSEVTFLLGERSEANSGERVVIDRFHDRHIWWARERQTSDIAESGRPYVGRPAIDIIREFHKECPWREIPGGCRLCRGTSIVTLPTDEVEEKDCS
jgi:hypothetical protein